MPSAELQALIATKRANPYTSAKSVEELRRETEARIDASVLPAGTEVRSVDADGVACEWIRTPDVDDQRVFYFIHGGGYYRGSVASSRLPAAAISAACGATTLSVDYRLAPEHPYPAAIDDVITGYRWLLTQGIDPKRIVVGGISAGGGLTLALLLALRDRGEPLPQAAVPISPWTDLTQSGRSFTTRADVDPVISKAYLDRMAQYYLVDTDPHTPLASPLFGTFEGLPPLLIQVGSAETMHDDSAEFARRAQCAGVEVTLQVWDDAIHGWHGSANVPEATNAIEQIGQFYRSVVA